MVSCKYINIFLHLFTVLSLALADDVLQLGDSDFDSRLSAESTALVMFYAPWCGHCKKLKPEFEKAASILKDNDPPVILVKVDCTDDGKDMCSKHGVSGYPTLKIFKNGELSSDYNGPREMGGIVKYMKSQVGPVSKELSSLDDVKAFIAKNEVGVVYFGDDSSDMKETFMKVADKMRESVRFGHSTSEEANKEYSEKDTVILFRPPNMANKFESNSVEYPLDDFEKLKFEKFIKYQYHGLVGYRTQDTASDFIPPYVFAYFDVDYVKNQKGTNYWRNRILKVAQNFKEEFTFAINSHGDFQHELNEFGVDYTSGEKPVVCARNKKGDKFVMKEEFSVDNLEAFVSQVNNDELEPYLKSEPVPESQEGPVVVAVAKNFNEVVEGHDSLVEFYAPWCGHCKKLVPIYEELAEQLKDEDVSVVKMDATANDVPPIYNVRGFPTIYWKPKDRPPVAYNGGRELDDFVKYIAEHSTEELKGFTRKGKAKKTEL